jgi:hypothetical protein
MGFTSVSTYVVSGLMVAAQSDGSRRTGAVADYEVVKNEEGEIIGQVLWYLCGMCCVCKWYCMYVDLVCAVYVCMYVCVLDSVYF